MPWCISGRNKLRPYRGRIAATLMLSRFDNSQSIEMGYRRENITQYEARPWLPFFRNS
jgi:hypothetical protein